MTKYTLFVDESGQAGFKRVRSATSSGASPYMSLGGVLIPNLQHEKVRTKLTAISDLFGKQSLHCSNLRHRHKVYYARQLSEEKILCFGVLSRKDTRGTYAAKIDGDSSKYYNKCSQYLLEKVGKFMEQNNISSTDLNVCFEEGNFNYSALRGLVAKCRKNPLNPETKYLSRIDPNNIASKPKDEEKLLQAADLVAHALFRCVDKSDHNFHIPEPRYFNELREKFYCDPITRRIDGFGLKPVHKLSDLKLDQDVDACFSTSKP